MKALVTTGSEVELGEAPDPQPRPDQALIAIEAISLNHGEARALASDPAGAVWRWDFAGTVREAAADGSGPPVGAGALLDRRILGKAVLTT